MIQSSRIIRDSVKNHDISGILLTGYACFLYKNACAENNGSDDYISEEDLEIGFTNYINTGGTQSSLTKDRLHSSSRESVAWKIATKVYGMKKSTASDMMNLTDEVSDVYRLGQINYLAAPAHRFISEYFALKALSDRP